MHSYVHILLWDFSHSGDSSIDGNPAQEDNFVAGLVPSLEYQIIDRVEAPMEQMHPNLLLGFFPPQTDFSTGVIGLWPYAKLGIFMRVSLFGLSLRRTNLMLSYVQRLDKSPFRDCMQSFLGTLKIEIDSSSIHTLPNNTKNDKSGKISMHIFISIPKSLSLQSFPEYIHSITYSVTT